MGRLYQSFESRCPTVESAHLIQSIALSSAPGVSAARMCASLGGAPLRRCTWMPTLSMATRFVHEAG